MIKRTTYEYDIRHTGDEMDRLEILHMLTMLSGIIGDADLAQVEFSSEKTDLICVKITIVDCP
jgi:hypothetical protein